MAFQNQLRCSITSFSIMPFLFREDNETPEIDSSSLEQLQQRTKALNLGDTTTTNGPSNDVHNGRTYSKQVAACVKFVPYYITVVEESKLSSEENALSGHGKKLWAEYRKREGLRDIEEMVETSAQGWGSEKYEQSVAKHGDKLFQKFQKQLSLCPQQCLRYEYTAWCVWWMSTSGVGSKFKCVCVWGGGVSFQGHFWIRKGHPQILCGYYLTIYSFK